MEGDSVNRRLAAVMATDVVGYSAMMSNDEVGTLAALKTFRAERFDPVVSEHKGRIVKLIGDGTLVEFPSVVDAVHCAVAIQRAAQAAHETGLGIVLRIGINLGDIIIDDDDIYGDGVNIAARLEPLAPAGGICISGIVKESLAGRTTIAFRDRGDIAVKNIRQPVKVWEWDNTAQSAQSAPNAAAPRQSQDQQNSIAVLPFENMSGDAEQEYFSDGISEDIITDLSKVSGLLVIARNSSFVYKGQSVDLRKVGRDLGVGTVLEGSVRRVGNRVRITAQLIDAANGGHLWAERYDRELTDVFAVQDEVTLSIVDALKVKLKPGEAERISQDGPSNIDAYDCVVRARNLTTGATQNAEVFGRIVNLCEQAIRLDPDYAEAYAILAFIHAGAYFNGWTGDRSAALQQAADFAARAVELGPDEPIAQQARAMTASLRKDFETSNRAIEKALSLDANYAHAYLSRAVNAIALGRPEDALGDLEQASRLDPAYTHQHLHYLGLAHLLLGHFSTAAQMFRSRIRLAPGTDVTRAFLAAALGHLGEVKEAKEAWDELLQVNPDFSITQRLAILPFKDDTARDSIMAGLEMAGLAE